MSSRSKGTPDNFSEKRQTMQLCPVKELAGFGKIYLEPGETGQVKISVKDVRDERSLGVGSSVKDIKIMVRT